MSYLMRDTRKLHYQLLTCTESQAPSQTPSQTPLVVYLHGLLMDNLSSGYFTFAHRLREHAHILLYDLYGHGRSGIARSGYRPSDHLADLESLLIEVEQQLDLLKPQRSQTTQASINARPLLFVGCSYGGVLALKAARMFGHIKRVVLLEGHLGHEHFVQRLQADLSATGAQADSLITLHFQHWLHRGSERKRTRLAQRSQKLIYESTLISDLETDPMSIDEWMTPETLTIPIDALYGSKSDALPTAQTFMKQRAIAGAVDDVIWIAPNKTHALLWEATDEVITELECCIERVKALNLKSENQSDLFTKNSLET